MFNQPSITGWHLVPWKASLSVRISNQEWEYFWMGDQRWGKNWPESEGQLEGLEWQHQENAGISGKGRACTNTRIGWKVIGYLQLRKEQEQTPSHSKASGGTWWPFWDTGACDYNCEVLKTLWAHRSHPAGCLCRVSENCDPLSTLHFQKLLPVFPNNIALSRALDYVPVSSILSYPHWIYIYFVFIVWVFLFM